RRRDEHGVLPLGRERMILRDDRPAVGEELHFAPPRVDHRLDRDRHARNELLARAGTPVVQYLRILVKDAADAVAAILADDREALALDVALDRVPDVAEPGARPDRADAAPHALEGHAREPFADDRRLPDEEHAAGVAVKAVFDDRDVDVQDVAAFQHAIARNAVTDDVVDRGADRLREAAIVERRRNCAELFDDVLVTDA